MVKSAILQSQLGKSIPAQSIKLQLENLTKSSALKTPVQTRKANLDKVRKALWRSSKAKPELNIDFS